MNVVQEKWTVFDRPEGYIMVDHLQPSEKDFEKNVVKGFLRDICKQFSHEAKKDGPKSRYHDLCMLACLPRALAKMDKECKNIGTDGYQECINILHESGLCNLRTGEICNTGNLELIHKAYDRIFVHSFPPSLEKKCMEICKCTILK